MRAQLIIIAAILLCIFASCGVIKNSPKYQLSDGYYKSRSFSNKAQKVYIDNEEDTIYVYRYDKAIKALDTSIRTRLVFPKKNSLILDNSKSFRQASFDVDFVTMPFKYRPAERGFPQQFNTNLNGAVFLGLRNDIYQLKYVKNPLNHYQRQATHYGFSFGVFSGLGGTAVNPFVTNGVVGFEYDGVVWAKGVGAIIGINNFTMGLAMGFDHLLDDNRDYWIYQNKPWFGLAFGLNLN